MDVRGSIQKLRSIATTEETKLIADILEEIIDRVATVPTLKPTDSRQQTAERHGVQVDFGKPKD